MWISLGFRTPGSTNSSTSAMVIFPAPAIGALKFLAVPLKIKFPAWSPFQAFTMENSALNACSKMWGLPSKSFISFPSATSVPKPAGV